MADLPINYLDSGKVARDKINDSFNKVVATVEGYRPHIENGIWWIGATNTGVKAVGDNVEMKVEDGYIWYKSSSTNWTKIIAIADLKGDPGAPGTPGEDGYTPVKGVDYFTQEDIASLNIPTTASDIGALPDSTKYGASISLSINSSTYVVTAQLKDQDGNNLGNSQTIDLPLESVVVSGSYDSATKKVVLTLQNGSTIEFSVADLVSGLQSEITSSNKLDSDLVDDTDQTNKFVTAAEKNTWGGKQDKLVSGTNIKTVNNQSLLGSGNITISGGGADIEYVTQAEYDALPSSKLTDDKHYFIYSTSGGGWQPGANTIAYRPFNGDANDYSGNGHNLTSTGSISYTTQLSNGNYVATKTGAVERVACYFSTTINYNNLPITQSCWCRTSGNGSSSTYGANKRMLWYGAGGNVLKTAHNNGYLAYAESSPEIATNDSGLTYADGQWHHIVAAYSTTSIDIYVDGNKIAYGTGNASGVTGNVTVYLGGGGGNYYSFNGDFSEFIMEDKTRTAQEISDYFDQTKANYGIS